MYAIMKIEVAGNEYVQEVQHYDKCISPDVDTVKKEEVILEDSDCKQQIAKTVLSDRNTVIKREPAFELPDYEDHHMEESVSSAVNTAIKEEVILEDADYNLHTEKSISSNMNTVIKGEVMLEDSDCEHHTEKSVSPDVNTVIKEEVILEDSDHEQHIAKMFLKDTKTVIKEEPTFEVTCYKCLHMEQSISSDMNTVIKKEVMLEDSDYEHLTEQQIMTHLLLKKRQCTGSRLFNDEGTSNNSSRFSQISTSQHVSYMEEDNANNSRLFSQIPTSSHRLLHVGLESTSSEALNLSSMEGDNYGSDEGTPSDSNQFSPIPTTSHHLLPMEIENTTSEVCHVSLMEDDNSSSEEDFSLKSVTVQNTNVGNEFVEIETAFKGLECLFRPHNLQQTLTNSEKNQSTVNSSFTKQIEKGKEATKSKSSRDKHFCLYCKTEVNNFARHLIRWHKNETEVQQIMSKEKNSVERKHLINLIRNKGNFLLNSEGKCEKPVKKKQNFTSEIDYLPCTCCYGFFSRKLLWRHKKKCPQNYSNEKSNQANSQNFLIKNIKIDQQLMLQVFPHMRADHISLVVKCDLLICAFGARYLKTHREKHFISVTSRKMRELAKLLIELKKLAPEIKNLFDALQPEYYSLLTQATKIVARYSEEKECFAAPAYAMNIATSLKDCCNIAITYALRRKNVYSTLPAAEAESKLKTVIHLIQSNWQYDISTVAANDLNLKKWNKGNGINETSKIRTNTAKKQRRVLEPWTEKQKQFTKDFFTEHIKNKQPPKKHECEQLKCQYPNVFANKSWLKIKVFVQNIYKKSKN